MKIACAVIILAVSLPCSHAKFTVPKTANVGFSLELQEAVELIRLEQFAQEELRPIVQYQMIRANLPYDEVNLRFCNVVKEIFRRTGKDLELAAGNYRNKGHPKSEISTVSETNGARIFILHVPAIIDTFKALRDSGQPGWRLMFRTHLIIEIMLELERNAGKNGASAADNESAAWARTCRHTIEPLVTKHNLELFGSQQEVFSLWTATKGDPEHMAWRSVTWKIRENQSGGN